MFYKSLVPLTLVLFLQSNLIFGQSANESDLFESVLKNESSEKLSPDEINEILEIRKRLGGGTGLEIDGLLGKPEQSALNASPLKLPKPNSLLSGDEVAKTDLTGTPDTHAKHSPADSIAQDLRPTTGLASKFRLMARRLEDLAADMEDMNLFENADQLREQAKSLRQKVRLQIWAAQAKPSLPRRN